MRVHFVDSTEPSVLAHEILNGKPYTFLDDAPLEERRTRAVQLRRGLPLHAEALGQLDPPLSTGCAPRPPPTCAGPRNSTTSCCPSSCWRPRADYDAWFDASSSTPDAWPAVRLERDREADPRAEVGHRRR